MKDQNYFKYILFAIASIFILASCEEDKAKVTPDFDNVLFMSKAMNTDTEKVEVKTKDIDKKILSVTMASPQKNDDVYIEYDIDMSLAEKYAKATSTDCKELPSNYFVFKNKVDTIFKGNISSKTASIDFVNLMEIPDGVTYVLPVVISNVKNGPKVLKGSGTTYYVVAKGAVITVVANIADMHIEFNRFGNNSSDFSALTKFTMEGLIKPHNFDNNVSTFMGIEGYFLIRIGDLGFQKGQIQFAGSQNFPASDPNKVLPLNEWSHIALTYDATKFQMTIYVNGKLQSQGTVYAGSSINLVNPIGKDPFYIGKSYDAGRSLQGQISECRIWNVVRTEEEIASNIYEVNPESENLIAYWKFDEGAGNNVKDHSKNGNDGKGNKNITWVPVSLP